MERQSIGTAWWCLKRRQSTSCLLALSSLVMAFCLISMVLMYWSVGDTRHVHKELKASWQQSTNAELNDHREHNEGSPLARSSIHVPLTTTVGYKKVATQKLPDKIPILEEHLPLESIEDEADRLMTYITSPQVKCQHMIRMGSNGDGGWDICLDLYSDLGDQSCWVFSFGIGDDWSFDNDMAKRGCNVHSFDPSIGQLGHQVQEGHWFYNIGLAGKNQKKLKKNGQKWSVFTLGGIKKEMEFDGASIDILKIDIEGMEWESLEAMFRENSLEDVKQIVLEIHLGDKNTETATPEDLRRYLSILVGLQKEGFLMFRSLTNKSSWPVNMGRYRRNAECCYQMGWIRVT